MTSFELKKYIIDLAFTTPSEAAFVSCYIPLLEADAFQQLTAVSPLAQYDRSREAVEKIASFLPLCSYSGIKGVAAFARQGLKPYFLALPMSVSLRSHVSVGPLPEVYGLIEVASRHEPFVLGIYRDSALHILFIDLGRVIRELRVEGPAARQANALKQALRHAPKGWLVLSGTPQQITALGNNAGSGWISAKLAGTVPGPTGHLHDAVEAAAFVVQRHREHLSFEQTRSLAGDWTPSGSTVAGPVTTARALLAGCAETVWLAADARPEPAFICGDCATVEWKLVRPRSCVRCNAPYKYETDSREQILRLAIQRGCSVELLWAEGALERFGGVACTTQCSSAANAMTSEVGSRARRPARPGRPVRFQLEHHKSACVAR